MCLGIIQKLITHRAVDQKGARYITDTLWMLMESGTEHVKVLQSVTLLLTTDCVVRGETLARVIIQGEITIHYHESVPILMHKYFLIIAMCMGCRTWCYVSDYILPKIHQLSSIRQVLL